ncbi:MAG TPA: AMED_5909 family protein [Pseudonocardiaceae bacterium]|nr:AMED_5909 family protein [Pseudonocardiaceae bacterium]
MAGPLTLRAAEERLRRQWPGRDASVSAWMAYYRQAAEWYRRVTNIDPDHYHEALYLAGQAQDALRLLTEQGGEGDGQS